MSHYQKMSNGHKDSLWQENGFYEKRLNFQFLLQFFLNNLGVFKKNVYLCHGFGRNPELKMHKLIISHYTKDA